MRVEAHYRDGHKETFLCSPEATLVEVVNTAYDLYGREWIKHLKVVNNDNLKPKTRDRHR